MTWVVVACIAVGLAVLAALVVLGVWVHRRQDDMLDRESTLTDEEKNAAQLAIALGAGNTFLGGR